MGWAQANWSDFEGRCLLAGIPWLKLDAAQLINLCYAMVVSDIGDFASARVDLRTELDKRLRDMTIQYKVKRGEKVEPEPFRMTAEMATQLGLKIPKPSQVPDDRSR